MPHDWGDDLRSMRQTVSKAWGFIHSNKRWKQLRQELGLEYVKALEGTHGGNGWHPHLHIILFTSRPLNEEETGQLREHIFSRWARYVERQGYRAPRRERCRLEHVSRRDVGRYLSKFGAALELVNGASKAGNAGHRTPWQILDHVRQHGRAGDIRLWREWAEGMKGARQLTWSQGTRARLTEQEEEPSDRELAEEEEAQEGGLVALVHKRAWSEVVRQQREEQLLQVAEVYGYPGVRAFLDVLCRWPPNRPTARPPDEQQRYLKGTQVPW